MKTFVIIPALATTMLAFASMATAATCHQYDAGIEGTVSGPYANVTSSVREVIVVRDQGAVTHPLELLIRYPGDMNAPDVPVGSIELMTNSMFAHNAGMASAAFDLGTVEQAANGVNVFQLDSAMALQQPAPNVFAAQGTAGNPAGLSGECLLPALKPLCEQYQGSSVLSVFYMIPFQGGVTFGFPDQNTIQGEMDITGSAYGNPNLQARYVGRFSGVFTGSSAC